MATTKHKSRKKRGNGPKTRSNFFKKIGPGIAADLTKALQRLTGKNIKVTFTTVETSEQSSIVINVKEKCFGSYVTFRSPPYALAGVVVAIFPLSSTKTLTQLVLKQYLGDREVETHEMKLSAFKEATNILLMGYITGMANTLNAKLQSGVPQFAYFRSLEVVRPALLRIQADAKGLFSVGQLAITTEEKTSAPPVTGDGAIPIKGRIIIAY